MDKANDDASIKIVVYSFRNRYLHTARWKFQADYKDTATKKMLFYFVGVSLFLLHIKVQIW